MPRLAAKKSWWPPLLASLLTAAILVPARLHAPHTPLLADRFLPGAGWAEIALLMAYAAGLQRLYQDPRGHARWRVWAWRLFSAVFFLQLALGLAGLRVFLMTGQLHLPVPGLVLAGPVYRGSGFFMPILFLVTVALVGPAWCSHLCYVGAWDDAAARARRTPLPPPRHRNALRWGIALGIVAAALLLRLLGISSVVATALGLSFGLLGVGVMMAWSRKRGTMLHCTSYCPLGLLANLLGKLNPFRVRIDESCLGCGVCSLSCRYGALGMEDIQARAPGPTCTLCGECLAACPHGSITYRFPGLRPSAARTAFLVVVAALQAAFLGLARV